MILLLHQAMHGRRAPQVRMGCSPKHACKHLPPRQRPSTEPSGLTPPFAGPTSSTSENSLVPSSRTSSLSSIDSDEEKTAVQKFFFPDKKDLPDDFEMPIWDHLEELRERVLVAALASATAIGTCFCFSKDLVVFLEAPVANAGVRFLQLSPGEFFFTTLKVRTYHDPLLTSLPRETPRRV